MKHSESGQDLERQNPGEHFLLEEYRNIAATHDHMRESITRMFYYFLLLSAVPFTMATIIFRDAEFNIFAFPKSMGWLLIIIGVMILFLSLSMTAGRLRQNQYAKTVNDIRRYFSEKHPVISPYLYLPKTSKLPHTRSLGHVKWYIYAMILIGATYELLGAFSVVGALFYIGISAFLTYCFIFLFLKWLIFRGYPN